MVGTSRSMPMIATCTRGIDVTSRPLPSFVTRQIEPGRRDAEVRAGDPDVRVRNVSRSCVRAALVSASSSAGIRSSLDGGEQLRHLLGGLLDRGRDDVHGVLAGELEDVLAEVGLDRA